MSGTATILRGNALALPLADASVDLIVTSPPYFGLRSYQDGGEHYAGQIGSEATPAEFVDALLAATAEMVRVLRPSGSLWVNLGDKYAGSGGGPQGGGVLTGRGVLNGTPRTPKVDIPPKSLMGIPWRYAIACIDQLGLILRAEVIWAKPNGLPESVTDRVRRSHEQWFHFVKQPRYFSAVDEIREEHEPAGLARRAYAFNVNDAQRAGKNPVLNGAGERPANPLGKLPGSVWTIPTQPLTIPAHLGVDHFAAFPMEWPRRIIQGWSPSGVCTACGEGRRPVHDGSEKILHRPSGAARIGTSDDRDKKWGEKSDIGNIRTVHRILGYACSCGREGESVSPGSSFTPANSMLPPTTPAVILDPFGGTGTVALVAKALGRHGISLDMSSDYCRLAEWRTTDPGELARALQVEKPPKQIDGQESLFDIEMPPPKRNVSVSLQGDRDCHSCGYRSQYARKPICDKCGTRRGEVSA